MRLLFTALASLLSFSIFCQNSYSLSFDGQDDYISIGDGSHYANTSFSFFAWVKPVNDGGYSTISGKRGSSELGAGDAGWEFTITPNGEIRFTVPDIADYYSSPNMLDWSEFQHIGFTIDDNILNIYKNGINILTTIIDSQLESNNIPFGIGNDNGNELIDDPFLGKIDDIQFWDIILSEEEIQIIMDCNPTGDEEGLAGYWNFDEGPFAPALDLSGNENHGVVNGASWSGETHNNHCVTYLCEQIDVTFLSVNTDITPNTIEFEIDVQYDDEYGFGYGGFVLVNDNGEIVAQENLETASNVYWIGEGINETRVLIANNELSFPFSGSLYLIEGFFAGNSNAECVYSFNPGCMNANAINYDSDATIDDGSCQFDNACNVDATEIEAFMYGYEPSDLVIEVGDQVTWTNIGGYHDVNGINNSITAEPFNNPEPFSLQATSGSPDSEGCIGSYTFTVPGIYHYDCSIYGHASLGMTGTITVMEPCNYSIIDYISTNDACVGDTVTIYGNNLCVPMNVHLQGWTIPNDLIIESTQSHVSFIVPEVCSFFSNYSKLDTFFC